jgi:hypothetical protein
VSCSSARRCTAVGVVSRDHRIDTVGVPLVQRS